MRKLWLTFTAMLLCSIASFAQITPVQPNEGNGTAGNPYKIDTPAEFMWINSDNDAHYELTADLNLGTYHADNNNFVITSFSGTFDGGNKTITYQASFTAGNNAKIGLFGTNSGTITNLNLDADITVGGGGARAVIGLLCGQNSGTIQFCNVTGNVNSTVNTSNTGNTSTGLIVGSNLKDLLYCTGHGNVTGAGYAGGLVGSMGTPASQSNNGLIKGCYFTGNVTANMSESDLGEFASVFDIEVNSCAGGICGISLKPSRIEFCVAEAIIVTGQTAGGITTSPRIRYLYDNPVTTDNNYCTGIVNGSDVTSGNIVPNIVNWAANIPQGDNYFGNTSIDNTVNLLEQARCPNDNNCDDNFYFAVINEKVVLIVGQQQEEEEIICEAPTGFTVVKNNDNTFTASWSANGEGANESFTETTFILTVTGGNSNETMEMTIQNAFTITSDQVLPASENPYVFTIESKCDENVFSVPQQVTFYVDPDCEANVTLSNVATTSAKITWQGNVSTVTLGNNTYNISEGQTEYTFNNLTPATTYTAQVIFNCSRHNEQNEEESYTRTLTVDFETMGTTFITKQNGNFNDPNTWLGNKVPPQEDLANITINTGHEVTVNHNLVITGAYKIVANKGVLEITQQGQLINTTDDDVPGIIEIVSSQKANQAWTFIGAPFKTGYKLETIVPVPGNDADGISDISVKKYNYSNANWSDSWAHIGTEMKAGEGYFGYPFYGGVVTFTTYGDVCTWDNTNGRYVMGSYNFEKAPVTALNNGDVTVTETITATQDDPETIGVSEAGYWMALSNPYPAKLNVNLFKGANDLQGNCVYVFKNGAFDMPSNDEIAMTEGFFVNFGSAGEKTITFNKGQLSYNNQSKASANEFIKLTLINGDKKVRAYLAHNEDAEQGYDIFDANKLFAPTEIAEPYFVTDGIALMKEEFAELPYYATMNVRSFADDTVSFVVNNIPEGLAVSIIDGENIIDMIEGGVYTTEILTGENADRFKVLIKKSVSINDVEELEVNITNNNRHISIETTETDLQVEVYNALGQKVLSTKDRNFTLNQVSAGAYLIKAFNNKASKTQKIVVE